MTATTRISRYECMGRLAVGGMAEILLARVSGPNGFERPVVIKRILPHLASLPEFRQMFLDEARIIARIRDDNVVQVHELGNDGEDLFLVMEYLEGESVGGLLRRLLGRSDTLDPWLACYIVAEAAAGLHTAHELTNEAGEPLGLVHRDISPQNVFVTYAGRVKLLDFGIAKVADKSVKTATGQLKGKFQYMSPEQCLGKPLERRSDIWALGVLLYELTTVSQPFKRANELLTFKAICEEPLPRPSQGNRRYPACVEPIVVRALSRDPELRFATAKDMRRELLGAMRELEGSGEASDALSVLMEREFGERRLDKVEMLQSATQGTEVVVPAAEIDEQIELPGITEMVSSVVATAPARSTLSRRGPVALALASAVLMVIALGYGLGSNRAEPAAAPASAAPLPEAPTASAVSATPSASVSALPAPRDSTPARSVRMKPRTSVQRAPEPSARAKAPMVVPVW